jgi:DNA-binding transcriptional MerR regulator
MRMQKRTFRIGYLARHLAVERFVIRFWEKEFNIKPTRSEGGQRFYDEHDLATFIEIKDLLYKRGFTIAGAKKQLETAPKQYNIIASQKTTMSVTEECSGMQKAPDQEFVEKLLKLKQQLVVFQKTLHSNY